MTKRQALDKGYCPQCAAYVNDNWLCGLHCADKINCQLPADVVSRWDADINHALKRRLKFGDVTYNAKKQRAPRLV
jgi:hypothetical protein